MLTREISLTNQIYFCFQTLLCINSPFFEVYQTSLSPMQQHVALIGTKGLMVLELPKRWGKNSEFEGGKSTINCRYVEFPFILIINFRIT